MLKKELFYFGLIYKEGEKILELFNELNSFTKMKSSEIACSLKMHFSAKIRAPFLMNVLKLISHIGLLEHYSDIECCLCNLML